MRKLVSLLVALMMIIALVPTAMADDVYTLDCYWVGNGDNTAIREGVLNKPECHHLGEHRTDTPRSMNEIGG